MAGGTEIAANDNWQDGADSPLVKFSSDAVGAFEIPTDGADAALLVRVQEGIYTIVVSGRDEGDTGLALVEVYQLNPE